jgi:hypothetical protein
LNYIKRLKSSIVANKQQENYVTRLYLPADRQRTKEKIDE